MSITKPGNWLRSSRVPALSPATLTIIWADRTRKLVGSATTLYLYDQADHLMTETNNLGTVLKSYIWRDNTPVAIIDSSSGQDKLYTLGVYSLDTL
jgi:hypothetical protein